MSENLVQLFTTQFSTAMELKLQQMGSKLRGKVREGFHVGKLASPINQVSAIQSQQPTGRFAPITRVDANFTRRWVFPQDREIPQLIDSFDQLRTPIDPKSEYLQNATMAVGRDWDDAIISATTGTAFTGTDNASLVSETFSTSSYQVGENFGGTNVGLTVAKMNEARRILEHNQNDLDADRPTMVIGSKQHADLRNQLQVVSTEFNTKPVLVDGKVQSFMGFDIVVSERLTVTSSVRQCLAFVKSGLYLGIWKDVTNRVDLRPDLSSIPYQLYTSHTYGSTRLQPGKVISIICLDSTGSDITF
jgi:hypothetical protein